MTTISANIVSDSISPTGERLTTMLLRYPRFIHAEFMTHRMFSRNASSSRAIPVSRLIASIEEDPAEPIHWGSAIKGMQAGDELTGLNLASAKAYWREDREHSIMMARAMAGTNAAKQIVNRLIENHGHITVLCTATEWVNFFWLRYHPMAQPEIARLACAMLEAIGSSKPRLIDYDGWHLPFVNGDGDDSLIQKGLEDARFVSLARCARTSYLTHDGAKPAREHDLKLAHDLVGSDPKHASPAEHQATPLRPDEGDKRWRWVGPHKDDYVHDGNWNRNFNGWRMYRDFIQGETRW